MSVELPASVRNELRRAAAVKILNFVYTKPTMKKNSMETLMAECFHGDNEKGVMSDLDMMVAGEGPYEMMYKKEVRIITDPNAPSDRVDQFHLVMKPNLHRTGKTLVAGVSISKKFLEATTFKKNAPLVNGRNLLSQANSCLLNLKKATSIALQHVQEDGTPSASGTSEDDVIEAVLDGMFALLQGEANAEDINDDDCQEEEDDMNNGGAEKTSRPTGWTFHGFVAFVLFGPLAPINFRLDLLHLGDPAEKKNSGRKASRKLESEQASVERSINNSASAFGTRGVPLRDSLAIASFRMQENAQKMNHFETQLIQLKLQFDCIEKKIERYEKRANNERVEELEAIGDRILNEMEELKTLMATAAKRIRVSSHTLPSSAGDSVPESISVEHLNDDASGL